MVSVSDNLLGSFIVNYNKHNKTIIIYVSSRHNNFIKIEGSEINFMSKQSNQRYRKETGLNHKERAKDAELVTLLKIWLVEKAMEMEIPRFF